MNWKLYCFVSASQWDHVQPSSSSVSSISRAGIRNAIVSYGSAATLVKFKLETDNKRILLFTHYQILICPVRWLTLLFPGTHEPLSWHDTRLDLWKMDLYHHSFLPCLLITDFGYSITGPPNLEENFPLHIALCRSYHKLRIFHILCSSPG